LNASTAIAMQLILSKRGGSYFGRLPDGE